MWGGIYRGQGGGRGRGDWRMTQMCKTEGNSGQTKAGRGGGEGGVLDDHDGDRRE